MNENAERTVVLLETIRANVPAPALYEQLAEEAAELTKEALKVARINRGENPTNLDMVEAIKNLREEVTDVLLCLDVVGLTGDPLMATAKLNRWASRIVAIQQSQQPPIFSPENFGMPGVIVPETEMMSEDAVVPDGE